MSIMMRYAHLYTKDRRLTTGYYACAGLEYPRLPWYSHWYSGGWITDLFELDDGAHGVGY
jgi:hypothetical protein